MNHNRIGIFVDGDNICLEESVARNLIAFCIENGNLWVKTIYATNLQPHKHLENIGFKLFEVERGDNSTDMTMAFYIGRESLNLNTVIIVSNDAHFFTVISELDGLNKQRIIIGNKNKMATKLLKYRHGFLENISKLLKRPTVGEILHPVNQPTQSSETKPISTALPPASAVTSTTKTTTNTAPHPIPPTPAQVTTASPTQKPAPAQATTASPTQKPEPAQQKDVALTILLSLYGKASENGTKPAAKSILGTLFSKLEGAEKQALQGKKIVQWLNEYPAVFKVTEQNVTLCAHYRLKK